MCLVGHIHELGVQPPAPPPLSKQATLGVGSINFRTADFAVHFSIGPTVCYVCCLIPGFEMHVSRKLIWA